MRKFRNDFRLHSCLGAAFEILVDKNFNLVNNNSDQYFFNKHSSREEDDYKLENLDSIVNNLLNLIDNYLIENNYQDLKNKIKKNLDYIYNLANKKENTNAEKTRDIVFNSKDYNRDSVINQKICNNLIEHIINNINNELI